MVPISQTPANFYVSGFEEGSHSHGYFEAQNVDFSQKKTLQVP